MTVSGERKEPSAEKKRREEGEIISRTIPNTNAVISDMKETIVNEKKISDTEPDPQI